MAQELSRGASGGGAFVSPEANELRRRTVHSLFWQLLGVGGQRVLQLAAPMVLARQIPTVDIGLFVIVLTGIGVVESLTLFMGEQTTISTQRETDRRADDR